MTLPIFDSRDGRTVIGYASGVRSAGVQIRRLVNIPAGFYLYVWQRDRDMQEMLDVPAGFVYSIGNFKR